MSTFLAWTAWVEIVGWAAFVFAWRAWSPLPDHGLGISKAAGVTLLGLAHWQGVAWGVLPPGRAGAYLALAGALLLVVRTGSRRFRGQRDGGAPRSGLEPDAGPVRWLLRHPVRVALQEALFLLVFAGWAWLRSRAPEIAHTEQPMDLMHLGALAVTRSFPPVDPWLGGQPLGYYYLGYWLLGLLGSLAGTAPEVTYNLGQACWLGLLVTATFGVAEGLARRSRLVSRARFAALAGGLALAALLASNLDLVRAIWRGERPWRVSAGWWWWSSARAFADFDIAGHRFDNITEFPFFSYFLGDDHPHLLSMPILAVLVGWVLALVAGGRRPEGLPASELRLAGAVATLAALGAVNPWDLPCGVCLVLVGWLLSRNRGGGREVGRRAAGATLAPAIAAFVALSLPFWLTAQSQVEGIRPDLLFPTPPLQSLVLFGVFLPGLAALALRFRARRVTPLGSRVAWGAGLGILLAAGALGVGWAWATRSGAGRAWLATLGGEDAIAIAAQRWLRHGATAAIWAAAAGAFLGLAAASWRRTTTTARVRALVAALAAVGCGLVLGPELAYVQDLFGTRMNTVFKLHYQAWLLFAIVGGVGLAAAWTRRGLASRALAAVAVAALAAGALYPALAIRGLLAGSGPRAAPTLDGLAAQRVAEPDRLALLDWIRVHVPPDAVVVEAPGESYRAETSWVSATAGRPTLLGWTGHEQQWRGRAFDRLASGRESALASIYSAPSETELRAALDRWAIEFVVWGPEERRRYGAGGALVIERVMEQVFAAGDWKVFHRRR
jgi:YYY domain-containing protein